MTKLKNTIQRTITACIGVILSLSLLFIPYYNYLALKIAYFIVLILSILEINTLLPEKYSFKNPIIPVALGCSFSLFLVLNQYFPALNNYLSLLANLGTLMFFVFLFFSIHLLWMRTLDGLFVSLMKTCIAVLYPGALMAYIFPVLSLHPYPAMHLFVILIVVFTADGFSYIAGTSLKKIIKPKKPLMPVLSPKKTLVGYIVGYIFALYFFFLMRYNAPEIYPLSTLKFFIFSTLVILCSYMGDLFESALKRNTHKKDSGALIPGRGGLLDTLDSFFFALPAYYIFLSLFVGEI